MQRAAKKPDTCTGGEKGETFDSLVAAGFIPPSKNVSSRARKRPSFNSDTETKKHAKSAAAIFRKPSSPPTKTADRIVSSSLAAFPEEQKKPPPAAAAAAAAAPAAEHNILKPMFLEAAKKSPSATAPELPPLKHRLFAKKPSPPSKQQQQDETAPTAPPSSNKRVKRAQHDEPTNASVEGGSTSRKATAWQQQHQLPIVIRGSASHKVLLKLGRLIPESLRDGPPTDDEEENVDTQEADGVESAAAAPTTTRKTSISPVHVVPSNKTEKPENVSVKLKIDRAVEEASKSNDKANARALAESINGNKEQDSAMKIDGVDASHPPNDAMKDLASADSKKAPNVPAPFMQSSKDPESSASAIEIDFQAETKTKNGEGAKAINAADPATGAKKDEAAVGLSDPANPTKAGNTLRTDAATVPTTSTVVTAGPSRAEEVPVNKPLKFCFRSCVMPQKSMYTHRNSYRVVISQGPHQGRSGYVVREVEGKSSVIQGDDGKEPVEYTASNMHLRMVAALDKSLRPRRQYTKRKNKDKATAAAATKTLKKRDNKPTAEDLFLSCLEEQLKHKH